MLSDLKLACFFILMFWCVIATSTCSYKSNLVKELKDENVKANLEHQAAIANLVATAKTKEAAQAKAESKAYEKFAQDIQTISSTFADRMRDAGGVQHKITETVKYLPGAPVEVREKFTATTADGLIRSTALLARVESVARQYDAELELCIARQYDPDADPFEDLEAAPVEEVIPDQRE